MTWPVRPRPLLLVAVLVLLGRGEAFSVSLNPGDIIVGDSNVGPQSGFILRVDPVTGVQTVISSNGLFSSPHGVAVKATGEILVADPIDEPSTIDRGAIFRVDPVSGNQEIVSEGDNFSDPAAVALEANGKIVVSDTNAFGSPGAGGVIRVNPADPPTGNQTVVSMAPPFANYRQIAVAVSGYILVVASDDSIAGGPGGVVRVDPVDGTEEVVSSDGGFINPTGIAIEASGKIVVVDESAQAIIRVDPAAPNVPPGANQTVVSSGGLFDHPVMIAIDANGDFLVTDQVARAVFRVDSVTGDQTIVSQGGDLIVPLGIAIVPSGNCGNRSVEIGEQCDPPGSPCGSPFGGFICGQDCECEPAPSSCGNGIIDGPETCDPPGTLQPPNGNPCRSDCTFCGDGLVQPGETCDDGNSGQCPNTVDNCTNQCTRAICKDPARIIFRNSKPDVFTLHGLIQPDPTDDPSAAAVTIEIANSNGTFFSLSLPAGSLMKHGKRLYVARDRNAAKNGGVALFKIVTRPNRPAGVTIKAFGDLLRATLADMKVTVTVGSEVYSVSGSWRQLPRGWSLPDSNLS